MPKDDLASKIISGDRRSLGKFITLLESGRDDLRALGTSTLEALMPRAGKSLRIGISGVPGVGKSTFIEIFGMQLIEKDHHVAVLAIDPSSPISGGSILGDRTRMEILSRQEAAFIRPSPTNGALGGVARHTRESILAVEAAGYDVVIVETVGVGQSESMVASMVDVFLVLQLPNAGDELQGIKKGVLELADLVVVTKCDGSFKSAAAQAVQDIKHALALTRGHEQWKPEVMSSSSVTRTGFEEIWQMIERFKNHQDTSGAFETRRAAQALQWFEDEIDNVLISRFRKRKEVSETIRKFSTQVKSGKIAASVAAIQIIDEYF